MKQYLAEELVGVVTMNIWTGASHESPPFALSFRIIFYNFFIINVGI